MDAVSPILVDRAREPQGLRTTVVVSLVVHGVVALILLFGPPLVPVTTPQTVMTISLGGATGAKTGGVTQMAGATTQKAEPDTKPSPAPPAVAKPEMVIPKATTKAAPPPKATVKILQDDKPRELPKAAQASTGDAKIQTSSTTQGLGLSTKGGVGTGGYLDVQNFCCPEYLTTMIQLIQRNWNSQQDVPGQTLMKFTVMRDGRITSVQTERSSGYFALDQGAQRALLSTRQLPPLPAQFPDQSLTVHLNFQYANH